MIKIPVTEYVKILNLYNNGESATEISNKYNVCTVAITNILHKNGVGKLRGRRNKDIHFLTDFQKEVIYGHLLGDGSIIKPKGSVNAHFQITRVNTDEDYLSWTFNILKNFCNYTKYSYRERFDKRTQKIYKSFSFDTRNFPEFTKIYNIWYPNGKKIIPNGLVLTPTILAIWIADDGHIDSSLRLSLATNSFALNEVLSLINKLKVFGNRVTSFEMKDKNQYIIYVGKNTSVKVFEYIKDNLPPLDRKFNIWENNIAKFRYPWDVPTCYKCFDKNGYKRRIIKGRNQYHCHNCDCNYFSLEDCKRKPQHISEEIWDKRGDIKLC